MKLSLVCVAFFLASPAFGASFDCGKATVPREKLICADKSLSDQDSKLAQLYSEARKKLSEAGRQQLITDQRAWLRFLTQACPISDDSNEQGQQTTLHCLGRAYSDRIDDLNNIGVRIGPFVFTRSVQYQAVVPSKLDEQDRDGFAGRGIGTIRTVIPKIDSPKILNITGNWNSTIARRRRLGGCEGDDDADQSLIGSVAFADANLISVKWDDGWYCHGTPHGSGDESGETLLLSPFPHELMPTDLFRPDGHWLERLTALVTAAVHKAYLDDYKEEPKNLDQKAVADAAGDAKRWLITADGLRILFSPYELGEGYPFVPRVVIPWSQLKDRMIQNPPVF